MCGLIGGHIPAGMIADVLPSIRHRGPDAEGIACIDGWALGHVRLSILDTSSSADQPMQRGNVMLTFNGEVWNHKHLRDRLMPHVEFTTAGSDTEAFAWLLETTDDYGKALREVNGMFAIVFHDGQSLWMARDRYGEVPLHYGYRQDGALVWASELTPLLELGAVPMTVRWVSPGTIIHVAPNGSLTEMTYAEPIGEPRTGTPEELFDLLATACADRAISDVPVACLMSGGIDSTAIAYHLRDHVPNLRGYIAVHDPKARDLRCAQQAADTLGIELVEVSIPTPTADDLATTVHTIEMPHKAQVEIGWACLILAQQINADGVKVVLSGEGSDELWASYGNDFHGIQQQGWHPYRRTKFMGQHRKNFARCNKVFMRYSIECRLPFLHPNLVDFALSLNRSSVEFSPSWNPDRKPQPKAILAAAYDGKVPDSITRRPKVAFQTGAKIDKAASQAVADPIRFYRAEYAQRFREVKP